MELKTTERSRAAPQVRVVHDSGNVREHKGVDTIEGWASPLIFGETMIAQSVEMPAGLSVPEHFEPAESMVYTVRGRWLLSVAGEKHLMRPGSMHWLREGALAGCEVPFDKPALILNFTRFKKGNICPSRSMLLTNDVLVVTRNRS